MNAKEEYEYTQLLDAYRRLVGAKSLMANAGEYSQRLRKKERIERGARASLRSLKAYQPTDAEIEKVSGTNAPQILAWIRRSRPEWEFAANCE